MTEESSLAEKISDKTEDLASSFNKMYSDEIGRIKILAIAGSALPMILAMFDGNVGLVALALSFILVLMALKKIDTISKETNSFGYMMISFIAFIALLIVNIAFVANFISVWHHLFNHLSSDYLLAFIVILILASLSTYFYYKSYIEVAKATGLTIFKIAAIIVIVSIFVNFISETLASILIILSSIFIIIGWYGIETIGSSKIENSTE